MLDALHRMLEQADFIVTPFLVSILATAGITASAAVISAISPVGVDEEGRSDGAFVGSVRRLESVS